MKTNYLIVLFAVTAAVLVTACNRPGASVTDDRIEASFKQTYVFKTYLKDDAIKIESKNGDVIMTGTVAEDSHKSLAQETVWGLPEVKNVDNRLEVKGERPPANSDGWLSMKVKTALLFHRNVNTFKTKVYVNEGIVTLQGEASSEAQKELATEYAKDVEGVKDVKNEMTIAKIAEKPGETLGEKIDDASITAQVKVTLMSHRSTSALRTKVTTTQGVVTVSGEAKNHAERDLVSKLVEDVHGVSKVVNDMTIGEVKTN
jgi:hyperosmotically inducible protein